MNKLVYGVGISEKGKYKRSETIDGVSNKTPEYELWKNMLARCYSEVIHKNRPRYNNCTVSENFKNFQWFAEWCNNQVGFKEGWQLEKDILFKNNKIYSEETCCFAPHTVNALFTKSNKVRGEFPIGVHYHKTNGTYIAQVGNANSKDAEGKGYIGSYPTVDDAFSVYKQGKESLIKTEAEKFKGCISENLYLALTNYEVEVTD